MLPKCSFLFNSQNSRGEPSASLPLYEPWYVYSTLYMRETIVVLRKCNLKMKSSTSTHVEFNLPGMDDVTDRKRPPSSFSLRLDPETPHTVCSWLLSLSFHKCTHTHTHTHTHKKKEATGEYRS